MIKIHKMKLFIYLTPEGWNDNINEKYAHKLNIDI